MLIEYDPRNPMFEGLEDGVKSLVHEPLDPDVTSIILCGEQNDRSEYLGFVALYFDTSDPKKTHHFLVSRHNSKEAKALSWLIIKGGFSSRLCQLPENPIKQEDETEVFITEHKPYAVLLVGRSGCGNCDSLLKLYFPRGFDPIKIFGCIYQSVVSKSAELN